jgi:hypothetical protein
LEGKKKYKRVFIIEKMKLGEDPLKLVEENNEKDE